jgi:uncharacterized protein (DUF2062 family)
MRFKSIKKPSFSKTVRELVWPSMGWRRVCVYYWRRVLRLRGSSAFITRGLVAGVVVCFTPLPFTHIFQAVVIAWAVRGSILAAMIASWAGNPWTYPFMWAAAYHTGRAVYDLFGWPVMPVPDTISFGDFWGLMVDHPFDILVPWIIGGYVVAVMVAPVLFYAVNPVIARAQNTQVYMRRRARILHRRRMSRAARLAAKGMIQ